MEATGPKLPDGAAPRADRLVWWIVASIVIGAAVGGSLPEVGRGVQFLGDFFLQALRMIVVPLVTLSLTVGICSLGDVRQLGPLGARTAIYFLASMLIAVTVGLILVNLIEPGVGAEIAGVELTEKVAAKADTDTAQTMRELFVGLLPANIVQAAAETDVLPLITFALFFGGVLTTFGERARPLLDILSLGNDVIGRMVHLIIRFAPIGIGCLVAGRLGQAGGFHDFLPELQKIGKYSLTVILGLLIQGGLVLPLTVALLARRNVIAYFRAMSRALATAFGTASSNATLPLSFECVTENAGVQPRVASFVLPLGATVNMDGTALYEAVAAVFIAQAFGIDLTPAQMIIVALTATLAAVGAAGIPEAGLVTMVIVLKAVDLPLEGMTLILAVDWFLDRCRTTVNVFGDMTAAAVVDRLERRDAARLTAAASDG